MENFKLDVAPQTHQFIDPVIESKSPSSLSNFVVNEQVWPKEDLDRHSRLYRKFIESRGKYQQLDQFRREILDQWTLNRLQSLVHYAYEQIPFYNNLYKSVGFEPNDLKSLKDFASLPVVNKESLREIYKQVKSDGRMQIKHQSRTSGSTGIPVSLINDIDRTDHWFVTRMHMFEDMMGESMKPSDWIYSIYYEPFLLSSILGNYKCYTVGLGADPQEVANHIRSLKPRIITGVASHVLKVAKLLPDAAELGILAFSTNSESSTKGERQSILDLSGVPVLDEYSSEELGIIAWEQRDGNYVVAEDTVHLELQNIQDDQLPEVVGTDLWNFTMPRLRYTQGDFAEWSDNSSELGLKRIKRILGRQDMALLSPTRGFIDPAQIQEIFDRTIIREDSGIREFRLVQSSPEKIKLLLKLEKCCNMNQSIIWSFKAKFEEVMGAGATLQLEVVSELPTLGRKRRSIVREFNV